MAGTTPSISTTVPPPATTEVDCEPRITLLSGCVAASGYTTSQWDPIGWKLDVRLRPSLTK